MTLRELTTQHPEWLDHTLVVYTPDGSYDYVVFDEKDKTLPNWCGAVYEVTEEYNVPGRKLLVFSAN